jgi:hypothetical protein
VYLRIVPYGTFCKFIFVYTLSLGIDDEEVAGERDESVETAYVGHATAWTY